MLPRDSLRGLSLLELMVTLAIASIILSLVIPSYGIWLKTARVRTGAFELAAGLQRAKSFSVKRGHNVIGAFNSPTNGSYQIVDDTNNNCVADGGELVLHTITLPPGVAMPSASITLSNNNVAFDPRGLPLGDTGIACLPFGTGNGGGAVTVQMAGHSRQYVVTLSLAGGVTVTGQ